MRITRFIMLFSLLTCQLVSQNYLSEFSKALAQNGIHKILCYKLDSTNTIKIVNRVLFVNDEGLIYKNVGINSYDTISHTLYTYDSLKRKIRIVDTDYSAELYYNKKHIIKTIKYVKDTIKEINYYKYRKFFNREITKEFKNEVLVMKKIQIRKKHLQTTKTKYIKSHRTEWEKEYYNNTNNVIKVETCGYFYPKTFYSEENIEAIQEKQKKCDYTNTTIYTYNSQNIQSQVNHHLFNCFRSQDSVELFEYLNN